MPFLILSIFIFVTSCSSPKVEESKFDKKNNDKITHLKKTNQKISQTPRLYPNYFKEASKSLGLENVVSVHTYAVDFNHDGHTDLVTLSDFYSAPTFHRYNKKTKKFETLKKSLFDKSIRASFLVFADFNKDGKKDVIVATLNQKTELNKYPLRLFVYKKGMFVEVPKAFPSRKAPTAGITLVDMDMDGLLDVYVANWYDMSKKGKSRLTPDRLYIATKKGLSFQDVSGALEGEHTKSKDNSYSNASPSFGSSQCDLDQNGYPDVLVASSSGYDNKVWFNKKKGNTQNRYYVNKAKESGLAADNDGLFSILSGGNTFYMICSDYNDDGLIDVAVGELFHSYDNESKDRSSVLSGSSKTFPPKFIRTEYHKDDGTGSWSQGDRRAIWVDLNQDSLLDLVVENSGFPPKSKLIYFMQNPDRSFSDMSYDHGIDIINPTGTVTIDVNRDGLIDLVTSRSNTRRVNLEKKMFAFVNQKRRKNTRTIIVKLKGKLANTQGIGASVFLQTSNRRIFRNVDYGQGSLPSQNEEGLWFTLTSDEAPLWFDIRWPYLVKKKNRAYPLQKRYRFSLKWLKKKTIYLELSDDGNIKAL